MQSGIIYTSNIHGRKSKEEKKEFEVPDVTTYDRDELDLKVARTQEVPAPSYVNSDA